MAIVMKPTYLILNQFCGFVELHTVKSGACDDCRDLQFAAVNKGPTGGKFTKYRPHIPAYIGVGYGGAGTKSFNLILEDRVKIGRVFTG